MKTEPPTLCRPTVWLERDEVVMLDRRRFPEERTYVRLKSPEEVAKAIEDMVIQGAGSIGLAAGYGVLLAIKKAAEKSGEDLLRDVEAAGHRLIATRPTGRHIREIVEMLLGEVKRALEEGGDPFELASRALSAEEERMRRTAELCGKNAASLLEDGDTILVHCFPGCALIYMLLEAKKSGKEIRVFCTETRPYLQGARLTATTLMEMGIRPTLITDGMTAYCLWRGLIDKVFVAADRIALDGSIANKVGTYAIALAAFHSGVPFYVLGYEGPDPTTKRGIDIPIEERNPSELFSIGGVRIAPEGISGYYPAFDVTPPEFISAIITDKGIYPPRLIWRYLNDPRPQ